MFCLHLHAFNSHIVFLELTLWRRHSCVLTTSASRPAYERWSLPLQPTRVPCAVIVNGGPLTVGRRVVAFAYESNASQPRMVSRTWSYGTGAVGGGPGGRGCTRSKFVGIPVQRANIIHGISHWMTWLFLRKRPHGWSGGVAGTVVRRCLGGARKGCCRSEAGFCWYLDRDAPSGLTVRRQTRPGPSHPPTWLAVGNMGGCGGGGRIWDHWLARRRGPYLDSRIQSCQPIDLGRRLFRVGFT